MPKLVKPARGRPPLPPEERRDHAAHVRLTAAELALFERLGGATWLRAMLKRRR